MQGALVGKMRVAPAGSLGMAMLGRVLSAQSRSVGALDTFEQLSPKSQTYVEGVMRALLESERNETANASSGRAVVLKLVTG